MPPHCFELSLHPSNRKARMYRSMFVLDRRASTKVQITPNHAQAPRRIPGQTPAGRYSYKVDLLQSLYGGVPQSSISGLYRPSSGAAEVSVPPWSKRAEGPLGAPEQLSNRG